ncbi:MAG: hypothetical protein QOG62_1562 [Thermoleophilaceae bacterium]|jgi:hypothetical protein|nr:hypothetical protein [Thermoleophilaceae bacterium]
MGLLKNIPVFRLLLIAELALVLRDHYLFLTPPERKRLRQLVVRGPRMTADERAELRLLVAKLEPRLLAGAATEKLSPVPLPNLITKAKERKIASSRRQASVGASRSAGSLGASPEGR